MKHISITVALIFLASLLSAGENSACRSLTVMGMYGWNETWHNYGGVDIAAVLPAGGWFEAAVAAEVHNPKTYAVTATARPKINLKAGAIFLDCSAHYRAHASYGTADFNLAASAGYRMDYFSVQIGATSHFTYDLERKNGGKSENISEPLNLLYRASFNVRPASSRWNVGGGVANYTDYEYERTWVPMFFLDGRFDIDERLSVLCRFDLKSAGTFHGTAEFWGAAFRAGVRYSF